MKDLADKLRAAQALSKMNEKSLGEKPKKSLTVVVGLGKGKPEDESEAEDNSMEESDEVSLAKEIIGALKEEDAEGLASALKAFMENC